MAIAGRLLRPTAVYFTPEQRSRLRRLAQSHRLPQAAIIRAGLDRALMELEASKDVPLDVLRHIRGFATDETEEETKRNSDDK
jgi:hypothetical protein